MIQASNEKPLERQGIGVTLVGDADFTQVYICAAHQKPSSKGLCRANTVGSVSFRICLAVRATEQNVA